MRRWLKARWALFVLAFLSASCGAAQPGARTWDQNVEVGLVAAAHATEAADAALAAAFTNDSADADAAAVVALEAKYAPAVAALNVLRDAMVDADMIVRDAVASGGAPAACRARVTLTAAARDAQVLVAQAQALGAHVPIGMSQAISLAGAAVDVLVPQCADGGAQ